jgi:hypothetical protein
MHMSELMDAQMSPGARKPSRKVMLCTCCSTSSPALLSILSQRLLYLTMHQHLWSYRATCDQSYGLYPSTSRSVHNGRLTMSLHSRHTNAHRQVLIGYPLAETRSPTMDR